MSETRDLVCPCGAPAPAPLPGPGRPPARCAKCATPLVAPGRLPGASFERGLGAALLVGVACAGGWALLVYATGWGASWAVAVAGLFVGVAARTAARARGARVQTAAVVALVVCFLLGEFLIYRHALYPRLVAMHQREGAPDAEIVATEELDRIHDEFSNYLALEASLAVFVSLIAGLGTALWVTRAPAAVAAFRVPVVPAPPAVVEPAIATEPEPEPEPEEPPPSPPPPRDAP